MFNEEIIEIDGTYNKGKLGLFFDPYIYSELRSFRSYGIETNRLVIVFWDISKFSDFCNKIIIGKKGKLLNTFTFFKRILSYSITSY